MEMSTFYREKISVRRRNFPGHIYIEDVIKDLKSFFKDVLGSYDSRFDLKEMNLEKNLFWTETMKHEQRDGGNIYFSVIKELYVTVSKVEGLPDTWDISYEAYAVVTGGLDRIIKRNNRLTFKQMQGNVTIVEGRPRYIPARNPNSLAFVTSLKVYHDPDEIAELRKSIKRAERRSYVILYSQYGQGENS